MSTSCLQVVGNSPPGPSYRRFRSLACCCAQGSAVFALGPRGVSLLPSQLLHRARATALVGPRILQQPAGSRVSVAVAAERCSTAMEGVARLSVHAHVTTTVVRRQKVAAEFQDFLDALPEEFGVSWATAGPEHVLWYAQEWLPKHVGAFHACLSVSRGLLRSMAQFLPVSACLNCGQLLEALPLLSCLLTFLGLQAKAVAVLLQALLYQMGVLWLRPAA